MTASSSSVGSLLDQQHCQGHLLSTNKPTVHFPVRHNDLFNYTPSSTSLKQLLRSESTDEDAEGYSE
jgi:hypothetical protein